MNNDLIKKEICKTAIKLQKEGLSCGTSGNISSKIESSFFITPSGISYDHLQPEMIVEMNFDGQKISGSLKPSSEWQLHREIYINREDINSIIHTHSHYSTVISCLEKDIPPFNYMIAAAGGKDIRCAKYATFGSIELAQNACSALTDRLACLLAHHGNIILGNNLEAALELTIEVENLSHQYCDLLKIGDIKLIPETEMKKIIEKFKTYGQ